MKKYLFMALAAVAALTITSCKNGEDDQPTDGTTITFAKKTLELGVGDSERLSVTVAPAGTQLQLKYASSNASVATVSASGVVSAIAEGEAQIVVSAEGAKGDTCYVTVSNTAIYNSFDIADWSLFGDVEMLEGTDTTLTWPDGTKYDVQLGRITLIAWDGNVVYSQKTKWSGAGLVIEAPATFWFITGVYTKADEEYIGYYIGHGGFDIQDIDAPKHGVGLAGSCNVKDYGDFLKTYVAAETSEDVDWDLLETAFPGAQLLYVNYTDPENPRWSDSYGQYYGHIKQCYFYDADEEAGTDAAWACAMEWHDFVSDDRYFGMKVTRDEDGYLESVVEPYDMKTIARTFYSENWDEVTAKAPRPLKLGNPAKIHKELPPFATGHKDIDRLYKK